MRKRSLKLFVSLVEDRFPPILQNTGLNTTLLAELMVAILILLDHEILRIEYSHNSLQSLYYQLCS